MIVKGYHDKDIVMMRALQAIFDLALRTFPIFKQAREEKSDLAPLSMFVDGEFVDIAVATVNTIEGAVSYRTNPDPRHQGITIEVGTFKINFCIEETESILENFKSFTKVVPEPVNNCKMSSSVPKDFVVNPKNWQGIAEQFTSLEEIETSDEYNIARENYITALHARVSASTRTNKRELALAIKLEAVFHEIWKAWKGIHDKGTRIDWVRLAEWKAAEARRKMIEENHAILDLLELFRQNNSRYEGYEELSETQLGNHAAGLYELFERHGLEPTYDPKLVYDLHMSEYLKKVEYKFEDYLKEMRDKLEAMQEEHDKEWLNKDGSVSKRSRSSSRMMSRYNGSMRRISDYADGIKFYNAHRTGIEKAMAGDYSPRTDQRITTRTLPGRLERHLERTLPDLSFEKRNKIEKIVAEVVYGTKLLEDWANTKQTVTVAQILEEAKIHV